jgi:hypothetical protein
LHCLDVDGHFDCPDPDAIPIPMQAILAMLFSGVLREQLFDLPSVTPRISMRFMWLRSPLKSLTAALEFSKGGRKGDVRGPGRIQGFVLTASVQISNRRGPTVTVR